MFRTTAGLCAALLCIGGCAEANLEQAQQGLASGECVGDFEVTDYQDVREAIGQCKIIRGKLHIEGYFVENLDAISSLEEIEELELLGTRLETLEVLAGIRLGDLTLKYNSVLMSLAGLESVEALGNLTIEGNARLKNLEGLSNLNTLAGLLLQSNGSLESLSGLERLSSVGELTIRFNRSLKTLDLGPLTHVGLLHVGDNLSGDLVGPNLASAGNIRITEDGISKIVLNKLLDITNDLSIHSNEPLTRVEANSLESIGGTLFVKWNDALTTLSLPNLGRAKALKIEGNQSLPQSDVEALAAQVTAELEEIAGNGGGSF